MKLWSPSRMVMVARSYAATCVQAAMPEAVGVVVGDDSQDVADADIDPDCYDNMHEHNISSHRT